MKKNEKLDGLQGQIGEMHNDFEDMKRTREEARKQLEAKFLDIYKIIEECMASHTVIPDPDVPQILDTEKWVYDFVESRW